MFLSKLKAPLPMIAILLGSALALGEEPPLLDGGFALPNGARFRYASLHLRHPGEIRNSALSPDGKLLATASGSSVMIWDLNTGRVQRQFTTPEGPSYSSPGLTFSPDGTMLGHVHTGESARVWNVKTGKEILVLDGKVQQAGHGRFTPDGAQFIIADHKGIHFWNLKTGIEDRFVPTKHRPMLSPDAKMYVRVDAKAVTILGDAQTGKELHKLDVAAAYNGLENGVAFSPDSKWLVLVNIGKAIELRVAATAQLHVSFLLPQTFRKDRHNSRVGMTRDSKFVFLGMTDDLGEADGTLHRWDVAAKKELTPVKLHQGRVANIHDSPDGSTLITTGADGLIRRWNLMTGEPLAEPEGYASPTHAALSPNGRLVIAGDAHGRLDLWDAQTGKQLRTLQKKGPAVKKLAFGPKSDTFAVAKTDGVITLWSLSSGPTGKTFSLPKKKDDSPIWVQALRFSPDGRYLYVCNWCQLMRYELATGNVQSRSRSCDFALSADGIMLATAYTDKLTLWDERAGKVRVTSQLRGESEGIGYSIPLAFSPDGRLLAGGLHAAHQYDGNIVLFDALTGSENKRFLAVAVRKAAFRFPRESHYITALEFSPDGRWLISGGTDRRIRLWEVATAKQFLEFDGHYSGVAELAFSPDARTAFSGAGDGQSYMWDLRPAALAKETRETLWEALASVDAGRAYGAVWALSEDARGAARWLRSKIVPVKAPDLKQLRKLIADLGSEVFRTRDLAQKELTKYGDRAAAALEQALKELPTLEEKRRLENLLGALKRDPSLTDLREIRVIQALELSATPEAHALLSHWATGAPGTRLTEDAKAAKSRLDSSSGKK